MNIYSLEHIDKKLTIAVDLKNVLSLNNKEIDMLSEIIASNLNRKTNKEFTTQQIKDLLIAELEFPLTSSTFEFKFNYDDQLELSFKSYSIINQDLNHSNQMN